MILEISRKTDAFRQEHLSGKPDRDPFHAVLPLKNRRVREMGRTVIL